MTGLKVGQGHRLCLFWRSWSLELSDVGVLPALWLSRNDVALILFCSDADQVSNINMQSKRG